MSGKICSFSGHREVLDIDVEKRRRVYHSHAFWAAHIIQQKKSRRVI